MTIRNMIKIIFYGCGMSKSVFSNPKKYARESKRFILISIN